MRALCILSRLGTHGMRALRIRYLNKKPHTFMCGQKKKDFLSEVLYVGITYFHGLGKLSSRRPQQSGGLLQAHAACPN